MTSTNKPEDRRQPTSHEVMSGRPWDASYQDESPAPWDIGQPQPTVQRLVDAGAFRGPVLDAGCGSGENTLLIASLGRTVVGVDVAETAIAIAREKAAARGVAAEFVVEDAFHFERLGRKFQSVLDCGLFHTFNAEERRRYASSIAEAVHPGGVLYILCFSDEGPETGPHPITQENIREAFGEAGGWEIASIERDRVLTRFHANGAPAWLVTVCRR